MRVSELIKKLEGLPQEAVVCVPDYTGCGCEPDGEYRADNVVLKNYRMDRTLVVIS
jgi:hypothetical protein